MQYHGFRTGWCVVLSVLISSFIVSSLVSAQDFGRGMMFDDEAYESIPVISPLMRGGPAVLPVRASLKQFAPRAGNQGRTGTCVGWATAYAARTIIRAQSNNWTDKDQITANAFSPSYVYNKLKYANGSDTQCTMGAYIPHALDVMKGAGSMLLSSFPFQCNRTVQRQDDLIAADNKIIEYSRLFGSSSTDKISPIKQSLAVGKPVVLGMYVPTSFLGAINKEVWDAPQPYEEVSAYDGHAMTIVGYDDELYGGAFEVLNSWGTRWGSEGFIWIRYDDFSHFSKYAFDVYPDPVSEPDEAMIAGSVSLTFTNGETMPLQLEGDTYTSNTSFPSFSEFEADVKVANPAYIYAFATDLSRSITKLFPVDNSTSPYVGYAGGEVSLNGEDVFFFDGRPGRDYLAILFSAGPIDIDSFIEQVSFGYGRFASRVDAALETFGLSKADAELGPESVSFSAVSGDDMVVPLIIELKHSDENIGSDSIPPSISLFDSESQSFYTEETVQLIIHAPDSVYRFDGFAADESGIAAVLVDDISVEYDSTGRFSQSLRVAVADTIVTRIEAVDRSGLSRSIQLTLINELLDEAAPEIEILSPRVVRGRLRGIGRRSRTRKITVNGMYKDQSMVSGIYVNGVEATITTDSTFAAEIVLKSTVKTFEVTAVDEHDNREITLFQILDEDQTEAAMRQSPDFIESDPEYAIVDVYYGTDRFDTSEENPKDRYSGERGRLSYGRTMVSIPKGHQVGELESPSWLKFEFREDPEKHIVLLDVTPMDQSVYFSEINHSLSETGSNSAFVYVHGFKTTFEEAARRTAQLVYDLGFDGIPFFYSWPSDGGILRYNADEADVRWTVPHLKEFLMDIVENTGVENFHIIGHSMGNRAVADALVEIARDYDEPLFKQVILSAPDIDADIFVRDIAPNITKIADRVTLYASSRDRALQASKKIHGYPRLGETGDHLVLVDGIDTVDASSINTDLLGHSYFAETRPLLEDLYDILSKGLAPAARDLLPRVRDFLDYWLLLTE